MLRDATISRQRSKARQLKGFKNVQTNLSDYNFSKNSAQKSQGKKQRLHTYKDLGDSHVSYWHNKAQRQTGLNTKRIKTQ